MKFFSNDKKQNSSFIRKTAFAFICGILVSLPIEASPILNSFKVLETSKNELILFPDNKIKDYSFQANTAHILTLDIYDYELEKDNQLIISPNPKIKFIRLSQINKSPNVVRATIVFKEQQKINSKNIDNKIVLELISQNNNDNLSQTENDFSNSLKNNHKNRINKKSNKVAKELLFRDLNIKDSLQIISKMMNINLIIHDSVKDKKINFYVENLQLDDLLDLLIDSNGLVKKEYGNNTYVVGDKNRISELEERIYKTFKLNNAKADEIINLIKNNKSLKEKINTDYLSVNERLNSISIYDIKDNVNLVEKIIKNADEELKQAIIEIKLVEINRKGLKHLGVNCDDDNIKLSEISHLPTNYSLPKELEYLEQDSKAKILASPQIRTIHGKKASINIEKIIPVPYYNNNNDNKNSYSNLSNNNKEYRDVKVGLKLEVTPEITSDNEITMDLSTSVDSILGINKDGQISKSERDTQTFIRAKNGETVVLAGFIDQSNYEPKKNNSLLSKIPILKGLAKKEKPEINRTEMIMLVTPRLVDKNNK